ncbi:probable 3-beta-hydroxysteroid-Delta(8),Delta(7)-isomerase [Beta vulgaris subsp. vulgaris]|uniref:probable 3-beta-hydroxysteroid-Delta(8),Delta(7)-isomerase n=1 Tax=Beta vulgaris subsp. vulgaris TaxID=3555 RepID=UPI002036EC78|nr:probable 3-beta-hydroxysteroid-Delta(8),Delta(7)-isomerase [Beta vulgaris subsp. vulgaris]
MEGHPYSPKDLHLPEFTPNLLPGTTIFGIFVVASVIVFSISWILSGLLSKSTKVERLLICWFTFNGLLYMTVELYLPLRPHFYKDKTGFYLDEIWKEFSKGDSRYAIMDSNVVALQGVTVFIAAPACLSATYAIATHKSYRYVLQLAISLWQCYGFTIYYLTAFLEGNHFSASPYYYYAYFIGVKLPWILIPFLIIKRCWRKICEYESKNKTKFQ